MKYYRFANLLAILLLILSGLSSIAVKTSEYFAVPATIEEVENSPATDASMVDASIAQISQLEQKTTPEIASTAKYATKTVSTPAKSTTPICNGYYGYISIVGKTICLSSTNSTGGSLSYSHAYIFNNSSYNSYNQYIFGHNSSNIFGNLAGLPIGTTFSVTVNGQTSNYRVSLKEVVCDYSNPSHPCSNYSEPVLNMHDAVYPSRKGANLAIMTCAGASIGNGDATHRLLVYATKF